MLSGVRLTSTLVPIRGTWGVQRGVSQPALVTVTQYHKVKLLLTEVVVKTDNTRPNGAFINLRSTTQAHTCTLHYNTDGMWQYNIVSFHSSFIYTKRLNPLHGRSVSSVYLSLLAERRRNDCVETKWLCGLHIQLGRLFKKVALGRIRCFCLSQAGRDVQQVHLPLYSLASEFYEKYIHGYIAK